VSFSGRKRNSGKITFYLHTIYIEGKTSKVDEEIKFKLTQERDRIVGEILEPNPIKTKGYPLPLYVLIVAYSYKDNSDLLPIAENMLLKGYTSYFEDDVKRVLKEQEARIILEGIFFHNRLEKQSSTLKEAFISFEQENFAHTKTLCRRVLEGIKQIVSKWKRIDNSESLCDKFKSIVNSLYSFASIGGPHKGITTKEETELILKNTTSLLFYVNSLLKNQRVEVDDG
ncbi:hypothetical protein DRN84_03430, partial [Candidatus Geothermarchaeota archaeon]